MMEWNRQKSEFTVTTSSNHQKKCCMQSFRELLSSFSSRTWTAERTPWPWGVASLGQIDQTSELPPLMSPDQNCRPQCSNGHGRHPGVHSMPEELLQIPKGQILCKRKYMKIKTNLTDEQTVRVICKIVYITVLVLTYRDWTSAPGIAVSKKTSIWWKGQPQVKWYNLFKLREHHQWSLRVAKIISQGLQCISTETIFVHKNMIMSWAACSLSKAEK